jgi:hypothetical protein
MGNQLKVFSWNVPDDKTDDGFHFFKFRGFWDSFFFFDCLDESIRNLNILGSMIQITSIPFNFVNGFIK